MAVTFTFGDGSAPATGELGTPIEREFTVDRMVAVTASEGGRRGSTSVQSPGRYSIVATDPNAPEPEPEPDPPTVSGTAPASGPADGGTVVTVTGQHLTGATGITFGGTAGTAFGVTSATSAHATTPAHAAGQVALVLQHPLGNVTRPNAFTYDAEPEPDEETA